MKGERVDIAKVIELYNQGLSMAEIGRQLGHDHSVIAYHLCRNKIPIRSQGESQTRRIRTDYLAQRYNEGASLLELGDEVGLTGQGVYQRLIKAGVRIRTISEAVALSYKTGRSVALRQEKNHWWKGGRFHDSNGYIMVQRDGRPYREHRLVWETANGKLPDGYIVHHLNGDREDNRLENLVALPRKRHSPTLIVAPYRKRILELEAQVEELSPYPNRTQKREENL